MILELVHDPILLALKSDNASEEDADTVQIRRILTENGAYTGA